MREPSPGHWTLESDAPQSRIERRDCLWTNCSVLSATPAPDASHLLERPYKTDSNSDNCSSLASNTNIIHLFLFFFSLFPCLALSFPNAFVHSCVHACTCMRMHCNAMQYDTGINQKLYARARVCLSVCVPKVCADCPPNTKRVKYKIQTGPDQNNVLKAPRGRKKKG